MKLTRRQTTTITRERAINFAKRDFVYKQEKVINQTEYTLCWCDRYNNGHRLAEMGTIQRNAIPKR